MTNATTTTVAQVRELFNEMTNLVTPNLPQWGKFDRGLVGVLLEEIDRLTAEVAEERATFDQLNEARAAEVTDLLAEVERLRARCDLLADKLEE